jgi:hypothetical protein
MTVLYHTTLNVLCLAMMVCALVCDFTQKVHHSHQNSPLMESSRANSLQFTLYIQPAYLTIF